MKTQPLYRIYVENVRDLNGNSLPETLCASAFDCITCISAKGYWKGQPEESMVVEILTDDEAGVLKLADVLRNVLQQQAVLVTRTDTAAVLVDGKQAVA